MRRRCVATHIGSLFSPSNKWHLRINDQSKLRSLPLDLSLPCCTWPLCPLNSWPETNASGVRCHLIWGAEVVFCGGRWKSLSILPAARPRLYLSTRSLCWTDFAQTTSRTSTGSTTFIFNTAERFCFSFSVTCSLWLGRVCVRLSCLELCQFLTHWKIKTHRLIEWLKPASSSRLIDNSRFTEPTHHCPARCAQ